MDQADPVLCNSCDRSAKDQLRFYGNGKRTDFDVEQPGAKAKVSSKSNERGAG
jgi:hypothetical protein